MSEPATCLEFAHDEVAAELIALETGALRRWGAGDPDGYLELCDEQVTYFDPLVDGRVNGLVELRRYYDAIRGQVRIDRFELVDPRVVVGGSMAVLSFNFRSEGGNDLFHWHCTEVYFRRPTGWRLVQTHWSWVRPQPPPVRP